MTNTQEGNHSFGFQAFYRSKNCEQELISSLLHMEREKLKVLRRSDKPICDNIEDCLRCPNCRGVLIQPYTLACGHTICGFCLHDEHFGDCCCLCEGIDFGETSAPTFLLCNVTNKWFPEQTELAKIKNTAQRLLQENDFQGALENLSSKTFLNGQFQLDCNYLCLRSDCNAGLGNLNLALEDIESALTISPYAVHVLKRKANILLKMGNSEKAVLVYVRLSALKPTDAKLLKEINSSLNGLLRVDFNINWKEAVTQKNVVINSDHIMSKIPGSVGQEGSVLFKEEATRPELTHKMHRFRAERGVSESSGSRQSISIDPSFNEQPCIDEFDCKLCCSLLFKPVTSPCGHTFCDECLRRSLDFRVDCPCCRRPLTKYLAERRTNVTHIVENMIKILFPQEYVARKKDYESEMESMKSASKCPEFETPIFVCTLGFPSVPCPLHIFEPCYKLMIRRCIESGSRQFGMCTQSPDANHPFATTGTMLKISDVAYLPDGRSLINTEGAQRFEVLSFGVKDGYNVAKVRYLVDENVDSEEEKNEILKLHENGYKLLKFWFGKLSTEQKDCIVNAIGNMPNQDEMESQTNDEPKWLWWALAALPLMDKPKLIILSMTSKLERLRSIWRFMVMMIKIQERNSASSNE